MIMMNPNWPPREEQTGKLLPILDQITFVPKDGKSGKPLHTFRTRWFMTPHASRQWDANITAISDDGRYLFGCHSSEYFIEVLDLDAEGRYIAKVPIVHQIQLWRDGKVYFFVENEDGYKVLKCFRARWER